jgi:uncharacterized damage-inducible protein DinB
MVSTKQDIVKAASAFVDRAESTAAGLSTADWQKTVYEGGWNVKQVYCHLAAMGGTALFLINMAASPLPPSGGGQGGFDVDAWNAREVGARQARSIEQILAELKSGYARSIDAIKATSDELLAKEMTTLWGESGTLAELIMTSVIDHNGQHLDDVESALRAS